MRTFTAAFGVGDPVLIKELEKRGVVIALYLDSGGLQYKVRYFDLCEARELLLYPWEITEGTTIPSGEAFHQTPA